MTDFHRLLSSLRRPRLLVRAARLGQCEYNRTRDLRRLMRASQIPGPETALTHLIAEEALLEADRRAGGATYSVARHIDLLIAMMAEARILPQAPWGRTI